jgi:hypothetical protein
MDAVRRAGKGKRMRKIITTVVACFSLGCYVGTPLTSARPVAGSRVQLSLTDAGTVAMASQLGPSRVGLEGDIAAASDSSLVLALRTVTDRRGIDEFWAGEQVTVPRAAIASISQRNLSARRSALLAIAAVAFTIAIGAAISGRSVGIDSRKDPGTTQ